MVHVAFVSPPFPSHLRVFEALGEELLRRGHRVTFLLNAGGAAMLRPGGWSVSEAGMGAAQSGAERATAAASRPTGLFGILRTVSDAARRTDELCRDGPALLSAMGAEAVVGDETEPAAGLLAERLGLPHASLACALPLDPDPAVPLPFLSWPYDPSAAGLRRNRGGERVARLLLSRHRRTVRAWAARFGLSPRESALDCVSPHLRIAQTVCAFEFPRTRPGRVRLVGPIRVEAGASALTGFLAPAGRPLVFASLGTLQGHRLDIFRDVATACRSLGAFSVVAHCGRLSEHQAASIGADRVGDFFPQAAVLERADACVTHGGLNTVLDALKARTPLLVAPIAFDQPGVAARVAHHGAGEHLPRVHLSARRVRASLERLIGQSSFRLSAERIGRAIDSSGGRSLAADMIEEMLASSSRSAARPPRVAAR